MFAVTRWALGGFVSIGLAAVTVGSIGLSGNRAPTLAEKSPRGDGMLLPKAVIAELEHDCGLVEPSQPISHQFVIRNTGESALTFERGQIGHVNLMVDLPQEPTPPGGKGVIRLTSRPKLEEKEFRHTVDLVSNDPVRRTFVLGLRGRIRATIAASPSRIRLKTTEGASSLEGKTLVYSQKWKEFRIPDIRCTRPGVTWEIQPASPESLKETEGLSGYEVTVRVPAAIAKTPLFESLRLMVGPSEALQPLRELIVYASDDCESSITIEGERFNGNTISLGVHAKGERFGDHLIVKVRDPHRDLKIEKMEVIPGFLKARMTPCPPDGRRVGLYRIDFEIPPDAPACNYMGYRLGEVRITTDHPTVPLLLIRVELGVVESDNDSRR